MKSKSVSVRSFVLASSLFFQMTHAANVWDGGGVDGNWGTIQNWDDDLLPAFPVALSFGGTSQLLSNNDQTGVTLNGITFNAGAGAFTISGNSVSLAGNVTNSSTSLQTLSLPISLTAGRTINAASGDVTVSGAVSGAFGITKTGANILTFSGANTNTGTLVISAGTVKLGAANTLATTTPVNFPTGTTGTLDLAGFSQTTGNFSVGTNTAGAAGTVTSSIAGGHLTINTGSTNGNVFGQTLFSNGSGLQLTLLGSNPNGNVQIQNTTNSFSGGFNIVSSNAGSLTTANLATLGGLTAQTVQGVRSASAAAIGSGAVALDNGQLFFTASQNVANTINVSSRGGVFHMESTTSAANGGFTGSINGTNTFLVVNSNSGNNNIIKLGNLTGFTGTLALDTTNIGGVTLNDTSTGSGNSNMNVLWFGNGTNGGTGRLQYKGTGSATVTLGTLNNFSSGAVGSSMSGVIENAVASTTATFAIGNSSTTPASFQGVIRNGTGTVALTKDGTNTQTLTGSSSYTGATTVNAGVLNVNGSLASGSAVTVNSSGTLNANGTVNGAVTVNGGSTLGGKGTVAGLVTLAAGSSSSTQAYVNLVDNSIGTLSLTNTSAATVLGGATGDSVAMNFEVGATNSDKVALSGDLEVGDGGALINITGLGIEANQTYNLITFANGTGTGFATGTGTTVGALTLVNPNISFGVSGSLVVTANEVQLVTTGASAPTAAYWSGVKGGTWTSNSGGQGNFTTTAAGSTFVSALPGSTTDVFFSNISPANLTNTLGANLAVNSLTFLGSSAAASISGANQLSLQGGGITVESGNGGATLGMTTLALDADQTWTNNSSNPLTVTSTINGGTSSALTLAGNDITLGGASLTSGMFTNNATLELAGTSITCSDLQGFGSISNNAAPTTITSFQSSDTTFSGNISDAGVGSKISFTKTGSNALTLSGANTYNGATLISQGTLIMDHDSALGVAGTVASGAGTTIATGATLDFNGHSTTESFSVVGSGFGGLGALINSNTSTEAFLNSDIISSSSFTVGGAGNTSLQRVQAGAVFTLTKTGAGQLTLGTAGSTAHNNLLALTVNEGTVVLNMPGYLAVDRGLTINGTSTVKVSGTPVGGGQIQDDNTVTINSDGVLDLNGKSEVVGALSGSSATASVTNSLSASTSVFTVGGIAANTGSFSGNISDGAGIVSLVKSGTGTQTLLGAKAYTGDTKVNAGTLSIDTAYLADASSVYVATAGKFDLTYAGTDTVDKLYIAGVQQASGTWGATGSGATHIDDTHFSGTGTLTVTSGLPGYTAWITGTFANGTVPSGQQGPLDDPDGDGINNLLEYAVDALDPTVGNGSLGTLSGMTVTFTKRALAVTNGDVNYAIEESTDLGLTDAWADVTPTTDTSTEISYTFPGSGTNARDFARLKVTKP